MLSSTISDLHMEDYLIMLYCPPSPTLDFFTPSEVSRIHKVIPFLALDSAYRALLRLGLHEVSEYMMVLEFKRFIHRDDGLYDWDTHVHFKDLLGGVIQRFLTIKNISSAKAVNALMLAGFLPGDKRHPQKSRHLSTPDKPETLLMNLAALQECVKVAALDQCDLWEPMGLTGVYSALMELEWQKKRFVYLLELSEVTERMWMVYEHTNLVPFESPVWDMGFLCPASVPEKLNSSRLYLKERMPWLSGLFMNFLDLGNENEGDY